MRRLPPAATLALFLAACPTSNQPDGGTTTGSASSAAASSSGSSGTSKTGGSSGSSSGGSSSGLSSGGSSGSSSGSSGSSSSGSSGSSSISGISPCAADAGSASACVETAIGDPMNCGGCGVTCNGDAGQTCSFGACLPTATVNGPPGCGEVSLADGGFSCGPESISCPNDAGNCACPDSLSDPNNCGGCGVTCGAEQYCASGSCAPVCPSGDAVDLTLFAAASPACVPVASAPKQLVLGPISLPVTVCPAAGASASPYLATLSADPNNCGSCGNVCSANDTCIGGACVAPCGTTPACPAGQVCADIGPGTGFCVASCTNYEGMTLTACGTGAAAFCTLTLQDPNNCGSCGNACPANETCAAGQCVPPCLEDFNPCGIDGGPCGTGQTCVNGSCVAACPAGQFCNELYGACTPTCG